jgi:hypothetical protein
MANDEFQDDLTEMEQLQYDNILLEKAYNNSWLVLSGQVTFDELLVNEFKTGREAILSFDPESGPLDHELQNMIDYYVETEEYEKCAKLNKILEKTYPQIKE